MFQRFTGVRWIVLLTLFLLPVWAMPGPVLARDSAWDQVILRLVTDGFDRSDMIKLFSRPEVVYDAGSMGKKMRYLYKKKYNIVDPTPTPTPGEEPREKVTIYDTHLTPEKLADVVVFKWEHAAALAAAEETYGVPAEVIVAVLLIETELGNFMGKGTAFNSLAGMAAARDFEDIASYFSEYDVTEEQKEWLEERQIDKADWAYVELKALISYGAANGLDVVTLPGSIYGALGLCQFMPSNAMTLGVDGDGDGKVDLYDPDDAIHSVAKFLKKAGWKDGLSYEKRVKVVKRYNNDTFYAKMVLSVAKRI